uniref:Protein kinase domain-containing protein n=1 Tax=Meloidogyne floridensis TaxID=298350 RepID=A0A915P9L5_9BILA
MDFKPQNLVFDSKNELKAIDFGGSLLFADIDVEKEVPVILVGRRTTTRYFLPPELHSLLKSNLDKHYNAKDYASTKTDTWEFGILIFQMILLNERRYSTIDIDRWLYDITSPRSGLVNRASQSLLHEIHDFGDVGTLPLGPLAQTVRSAAKWKLGCYK